MIWESLIDQEQGSVPVGLGQEREGYHQQEDIGGLHVCVVVIVRANIRELLIRNSTNYKSNPLRDWATVVDCGDISNTPFDKLTAIHELEKGMKSINDIKPKNTSVSDAVRLVTIGGDHTISM